MFDFSGLRGGWGRLWMPFLAYFDRLRLIGMAWRLMFFCLAWLA